MHIVPIERLLEDYRRDFDTYDKYPSRAFPIPAQSPEKYILVQSEVDKALQETEQKLSKRDKQNTLIKLISPAIRPKQKKLVIASYSGTAKRLLFLLSDSR